MSEGYEALRHSAAWLDISDRGRIAVRGRDRARLLHNISSNNVKSLAPGSGCYAFLLSPQGRIQADLEVFCFPDHFLISAERELREKVQQHIRRYIIADQVELDDITERTGELALEGPESAAILERLGAPVPAIAYSHTSWSSATIVNAGITGQPGFKFFCPVEAREGLISKISEAGAIRASAEDARLVRIENGRPRYGEDMDERSLPQETQQMHAVSFTKGCYIGQEIVERIRARGHVNRKLGVIELPGTEPETRGAVVEVGGRQAEITSSIYSPRRGKLIALAYVRE